MEIKTIEKPHQPEIFLGEGIKCLINLRGWNTWTLLGLGIGGARQISEKFVPEVVQDDVNLPLGRTRKVSRSEGGREGGRMLLLQKCLSDGTFRGFCKNTGCKNVSEATGGTVQGEKNKGLQLLDWMRISKRKDQLFRKLTISKRLD